MKNILERIDKLLCYLLGFRRLEITPHFIGKRGNRLVILNTESYKRHAHETSISDINLNALSQKNKEKLGIAVGKAIATNLVVSYEDIIIKKHNINAS